MSDSPMAPADQDQDWSPPLENEVGRGRSFPIWIWGCGGGCLVFLMLFIGGSVWFGNKMFSTFGPEAAWPVLTEVMPYGEERPEGYAPALVDPQSITGMLKWMPGVSDEDFEDVPAFQLIILDRTESDQRGDYTAMLYRLDEDSTEEDKREIMDAPPSSPGAGEVSVSGVVELDVDLQGKLLKARVFDAKGQGPANPFGGQAAVKVLEVDLSEGRTRPLILQLMSNKEGVPLDEAVLQDFFAPFQVWRGN